MCRVGLQPVEAVDHADLDNIRTRRKTIGTLVSAPVAANATLGAPMAMMTATPR